MASSISGSSRFPADEASVTIAFEDGSLLILLASDRGNRLRGVQEYIEIRRADLTVKIHDFLRMDVEKGGKKRVLRRIIRDKGHKAMYNDFVRRCIEGGRPLYPDADLLVSSLLYLGVKDALLSKKRFLEIDPKMLSSLDKT